MPPRRPSVFVIGSSTTLLMHPHLERMLADICDYSRKGHEVAQLRRALDDLDIPAGASAGDTFMVLEYLHDLDKLTDFRPDLVLLHVGFHDIKRHAETGEIRVPLDRFRANVEAILAWFEQHRISLIWLLAGPLDENLHNARCKGFRRFEADLCTYNHEARRILKIHEVPCLDLADFTRRLGPMEELLKDHVHVTDSVARQQAAWLAGFLSCYFHIHRPEDAPAADAT